MEISPRKCIIMKQKALTLVEILVVVGILALLAALLFPVLSRARIEGYKTQSLANISQIVKASLLYSSDVDGLCIYGAVKADQEPDALIEPWRTRAINAPFIGDQLARYGVKAGQLFVDGKVNGERNIANGTDYFFLRSCTLMTLPVETISSAQCSLVSEANPFFYSEPKTGFAGEGFFDGRTVFSPWIPMTDKIDQCENQLTQFGPSSSTSEP